VGATVLTVLAGAAASGCHPSGAYMWVDAVPKAMAQADSNREIAPGDLISIRVFGQEANSVDRVRVRDDGRVSVPLLNDVEVAGTEPDVMARRLEVKLKSFITAPVVTVIIHERRPLRVSVIGRVTRPGAYDLERGAGLVHALSLAGGLTPFADEDRVFVLRSGYWANGDPAPARIRFRYRDLTAGTAPASTFALRAGDVVVVE
jgi:polysaccharide export outer membrane protein